MTKRMTLVGVVAFAAALAIFSGTAQLGDVARAAAAGSPPPVVVCSSCSYPGVGVGTLLLDPRTGDLWMYSDAAMVGTENPVHMGKLVLGQPVQKKQ